VLHCEYSDNNECKKYSNLVNLEIFEIIIFNYKKANHFFCDKLSLIIIVVSTTVKSITTFG
jgi:hypothetical protein